MTLLQMYSWLESSLGEKLSIDLGTDPRFYSRAEALIHINNAQDEFALISDCLEDTASVNSVVDQADYSFPSYFLKFIDLSYNNKPLTYIDLWDLYNIDGTIGGDWKSNVAGTSEYYYFEVLNKFSLYPKPDAIKAIRYTYEKKLIPLAELTDISVIPTEYHAKVLLHPLGWLEWKRKEYNAANALFKQFREEALAAKVDKKYRQPDRLVNFQDGMSMLRQDYRDNY